VLAALSAILVWSGIHPRDTFTWFLEVLPALLGVGILVATYPRFRFSMLVYVLVSLHAVILMVGGHYTYAEMPAFNWLRDTFGLSRNYYDRVGHFAQGFVPAIIAREFLLRQSPLRRGKLFFFIVVSICLAASAAYEFIEWWVSLAVGSAADAFLGTQGDVWDTQWDMFMAFGGAVIALLSLSGIHDRFLRGMNVTSNH
jgi:putative membrane protein